MDEARTAFGEQFLAYVLACDESALGGSGWSPAQTQVIGQLEQLANAVAHEHPLQKQLTIASVLLQHNPTSGTSLANTWRSECGGSIPEMSDDNDSCLAALRKMAVDIYPGFMLPASGEFPFRQPQATTTLFRHPSQSVFCHAVLDDEHLATFFPGAPSDGTPFGTNELTGIHSSISLSIGRGGGFQLVMLAETLLAAAYNLCLLSDKDSLDSYLGAVDAVLRDVRRLASGRSVSIPVVIGLGNVKLADGSNIRLPWGIVRNPTVGDRRFLAPNSNVTVVLVVSAPLKVLSKRAFTPEESDIMVAEFERRLPHFEEWRNDLTRKIDLTRYALLCGSRGQPLIAATHKSTSVIDLLQSVPQQSWSFDLPPATPEATVDSEAVARVEQWAQRLESHPRKLDIAMRRTLSATVDRLDPLDGFIDAVLAWENMFSDTPETTLKVCGSIARLLEADDFEARTALCRELQDLYGKRSKVVHGALEPNSRDAVKFRDRAIVVALDAMRSLYDHPDLLAKDSGARGKEILLGVLDKRPSSGLDDKSETIARTDT